jgi:hypothetical protein
MIMKSCRCCRRRGVRRLTNETHQMDPLLSFAPTTKLLDCRHPQHQASAMALEKLTLDKFRLPDHPDAPLHLNRLPLCVVDVEAFSETTEAHDLTAAIGIATVLYNWCPDALSAFLDLDAWFSFTWSLAIQQGEADETNIEIGRVGNQITFGTLDKDGNDWTLMLTYNISMEGPDRGAWIPNPRYQRN